MQTIFKNKKIYFLLIIISVIAVLYIATQYFKIEKIDENTQIKQIDLKIDKDENLISKETTYKEKDIMGSWAHYMKDEIDTSYTQWFVFEKVDGKNKFRSLLHQRPQNVNCNWKIDDKNLIIYCKDEILSYHIVDIDENSLTLSEDDSPQSIANKLIYIKSVPDKAQ